jgi:hypothetical protein
MVLFDVRTAVGNKIVLGCQQFHVKFGGSFSFDLKIEDVDLSMIFSQEFAPAKPDPYIFMKATENKNTLHYILGNLNKYAVSSKEIEFFALENKIYSFQLAANCTSDKINNTTVWLYSIIFYQEEREYEQI